MKKPKPKKHRPTLTPTALAWLAFNCPPERWDRIRELYDRRQIEAIFAYLKLATDEPTYRQFEEMNLEPAELEARRAAEAAKLKAEEDGKFAVFSGINPAYNVPLTENTGALLFSGLHWKPFVTPQQKQEMAAAQRDFDLEHYEMAEIPEVEF